MQRNLRRRLREQASDQAGDQVNITDIQSIDGFGNIDGEQVSDQAGDQVSDQVQRLVNVIREDAITMFDLQKRLNIASRR